jgi:hypothetical protein
VKAKAVGSLSSEADEWNRKVGVPFDKDWRSVGEVGECLRNENAKLAFVSDFRPTGIP